MPTRRTARRPAGPPELRTLAGVLNGFAQVRESLAADVEQRVSEANARIEEERNRLAALMSELTQSVVVCNVEGRILLYNARAMQLLRKPLDGAPGGKAVALVGLGRSVFAIFDRNLIIHALDDVHERLGRGEPAPSRQLRHDRARRASWCASRWRRCSRAAARGGGRARRGRLRAAARRHHAPRSRPAGGATCSCSR